MILIICNEFHVWQDLARICRSLGTPGQALVSTLLDSLFVSYPKIDFLI